MVIYPRPLGWHEKNINAWPTHSKKLYRQGRPGKKPRPVVCVRVLPPKRSSR